MKPMATALHRLKTRFHQQGLLEGRVDNHDRMFLSAPLAATNTKLSQIMGVGHTEWKVIPKNAGHERGPRSKCPQKFPARKST
ncbi:hypothetical protein LMG22037_04994 [Paraburkholderia phenoliruptrix]|jgi:hypothetical protein|uniref:Uncharacterized protein n=1 Tax=Paraburkholderia phenoliruptrix TaxID=252970 RepID=A0A6J5C3M1_9BURK|nr:hypothetical protein LMG22037_04994 [Paraburkholderia phenoliruptrix]